MTERSRAVPSKPEPQTNEKPRPRYRLVGNSIYMGDKDWPPMLRDNAATQGAMQMVVNALNAAETRAAQPPFGWLPGRITEYLELGGLWNPESMEHDRVRQLLMDCRAALAAKPGTPDALRTEIEELLEEIAGRAIDGNYAAPAREAYRTCGKSLAALLAAKPSSAPARPVMGDGDYSCATCGLGMKEPCEHWKEAFANPQPDDDETPAPASTEAPGVPTPKRDPRCKTCPECNGTGEVLRG